MASRRTYSRCPSCGEVCAAAEFKRTRPPGGLESGWGLDRWTRCPACGHEGMLRVFPEVEPPEGAGGPLRPEPGAEW
jgi:predicted RNA-binding Zn-ribbon protein involved in translation (DUF1610 family)